MHWDRVVGLSHDADSLAEGADRICIQLRAGLGRWIGVDGYSALHDRARRMTHEAHPVLRFHTFDGGDFHATVTAVRAHGRDEVERGMVGFAAAVIELLGRVVSFRMAIRLVEQTAEPTPRGIAESDGEEPFDGEED